MTISVIIPTYNGAHKLPAVLDALEKQTYKEFELIVAIDGSTDNTVEILNAYKSFFNSFSILTQENKGRSAIRNFGAQRAKGDLLIFFDDDMIPDADCVQTHIDHHLKYSYSILTGAQIDIAHKSKNDVQVYKSFLSKKWTKKLHTGKPLERRNLFITAANFSINKKLFYDLEGFDERLKDGEDFDLAVRAFKKGIDLYFNYEAFAWHNDQITCAAYIKRQRQYAAAHNRLMELKPWMVAEGFIKPVNKPGNFKEKVYRLFKSDKWVSAVDKNYFTILPRKLRYRLYDIIISANSVFS